MDLAIICGGILASLAGFAIGLSVAFSLYRDPYSRWKLRCEGWDIKLSEDQVASLLGQGLKQPDKDFALKMIRAAVLLRDDRSLLTKLTEWDEEGHTIMVYWKNRVVSITLHHTVPGGVICRA